MNPKIYEHAGLLMDLYDHFIPEEVTGSDRQIKAIDMALICVSCILIARPSRQTEEIRYHIGGTSTKVLVNDSVHWKLVESELRDRQKKLKPIK